MGVGGYWIFPTKSCGIFNYRLEDQSALRSTLIGVSVGLSGYVNC